MNTSLKQENVSIKYAKESKEQDTENIKNLEKNIEQIVAKNYNGAKVNISY